MTQYEINRKQKLYEIISILKLMSLLFCGMIIFAQYPKDIFSKLGIDSSMIIICFIGIAILALIYEGWVHSSKRNKAIKAFVISGLIENIMFISLYTVLIFISGFHESQYKFLFLFIIIANTIQYEIKIGTTTAIISSIIILSIDLIGEASANVNRYFEIDLVMSGVFIIIAWLLGYYVKLENQYREKARELANVDELTGIYNHRYFQNALTEGFENATKNEKNICLLFIDIDHFKYYNDLYGHSAGDVVLNIFGEILKNSVVKNQIAARYGGEEFAVILPDLSEEEAAEIGNKIREEFENTYFKGEENQPSGKLTISVGVSCYPEKAKTKQELINTADDALYRAKFFNKNRVVRYYSVLEELKSDIDEKHINLISVC